MGQCCTPHPAASPRGVTDPWGHAGDLASSPSDGTSPAWAQSRVFEATGWELLAPALLSAPGGEGAGLHGTER